MSDIFLSYSQKDEERVRPIVRQLENLGWSVFWDRNMPPGKTFRKYIKENLSVSLCVVVFCSKHLLICVEAEERRGEERRVRKPLVPMRLDQVKLILDLKSI